MADSVGADRNYCKLHAQNTGHQFEDFGRRHFCSDKHDFLWAGRRLHRNPEVALAGLLPAAVILALSYYLLNSGTVALMLALESHKGVCRIWKENFLWHAINYFACTFGAVLITVHGSLITPLTLGAAVLVVMIIYVGCRNILGRIAPNPHA